MLNNAGERLKEIRQKLNLTQAEFGACLGLTSQGISNIEKNKSFLTLDKLRLLKKFNINLNYLIYGAGGLFLDETAQKHINDYSIEELEQIMLALLKKNGVISG